MRDSDWAGGRARDVARDAARDVVGDVVRDWVLCHVMLRYYEMVLIATDYSAFAHRRFRRFVRGPDNTYRHTMSSDSNRRTSAILS